jgi:glycosyltransferase involved in cell wall biosynthesis
MNQKVAFGSTLLDRGLLREGVDGIGQYCNELLNQFSQDLQGPKIIPYSFGVTRSLCNAILLPTYQSYLTKTLLGLNSKSTADQFFKDVDLIHCTDQLIPIVKNKPLIATVMDTIPLSHPQFIKAQSRLIKPFLWRKLTCRADHIITISEFSKQEIIRHMGFPEEKITSIPLAVEKRFFEKISQEEIQATLKKLNIDKSFFLFIGSIQPRKNLTTILAAHAALPKQLSKDYPLVIAGKLAWDDGNTIAAIQKAISEKRCIWLNYVSDFEKRCLLQSTLGLVFTSQYEGFGLPILEGFASGAPVISSNCTSMPEVAQDAALLVDPNDQAAITDALTQILSSSFLNDQFRNRGYKRARLFSWENVAQQTKAIYSLF